ncbi:MAG TPA: glycosyl hydrolase family 65 protein [Rhodopseudomonas sp.]|uniref:glycoside hydrolase family 65 protein n=1 Tax=Rhodopseudomonas sp. TaxID=1078 RepID=UPI002ED8D657
MEHTLEATEDPAWVIVTNGYDPLREQGFESRFAISNGFLGVRGGRAATRGARWVVPAHTYVAGLFDKADGDHATPALVPAADWMKLRILLPSGPLVHHPGDVASHRIVLDLKKGALLSQCSHLTEPDANVHLRTMRFVSLSERAVGMQLIELIVEDGETLITLEASFEGMNLGLTAVRVEQDLGVWRTQHSGKGLAIATGASLQVDGREINMIALGQLKSSWHWKCHPGQVVHFERTVAIARSDAEGIDPAPAAVKKLAVARQIGWRGVVAAHEAAWAGRWRLSDVEVQGDAAAQEALRFAVYHLNSAANPGDERVSIGARALTGADYHGHVFWDTEIFLLPFYILTWPEAARALLMYRFHTLDGARAKASRMGWRGALYAWESAVTGAEVAPIQAIGPDRLVIPILCGLQEQHISADVAYAVWQYWQATGDEGFLRDAGAEILLETGRFWSSRAKLEEDGYRHIRGVIGPDEYHENIDDNAYTNVMARWNIRRALDVAALLRERWPDRWTSLSSRLSVDEDELRKWRQVAETIMTNLDPKTGLYQEFAGYFELENIDLKNYSGRSVPMDVVLGRWRTQKSQVIKQADVIALLALLPNEFVGETGAANFRFYEPRCGHGSSLSPAMHGLVAARLGQAEKALQYFKQAAAIDLSDAHVGTDGGVHIAALGGNWMLVVLGIAGLSLREDGVAINPQMPESWRSLSFGICWRGRSLKVRIDQDKQSVRIAIESGAAMKVVIRGEPYDIGTEAMEISLGARTVAA